MISISIIPNPLILSQISTHAIKLIREISEKCRAAIFGARGCEADVVDVSVRVNFLREMADGVEAWGVVLVS